MSLVALVTLGKVWLVLLTAHCHWLLITGHSVRMRSLHPVASTLISLGQSQPRTVTI